MFTKNLQQANQICCTCPRKIGARVMWSGGREQWHHMSRDLSSTQQRFVPICNQQISLSLLSLSPFYPTLASVSFNFKLLSTHALAHSAFEALILDIWNFLSSGIAISLFLRVYRGGESLYELLTAFWCIRPTFIYTCMCPPLPLV